jgi:hypothetical protein
MSDTRQQDAAEPSQRRTLPPENPLPWGVPRGTMRGMSRFAVPDATAFAAANAALAAARSLLGGLRL